MNEIEQLRRLLADYEAPVLLLQALREAASNAIDAYGTEQYNSHIETVFDITASLMALEGYEEEAPLYMMQDEPLFESDEPVSQLPDQLPDNVIPFPRYRH
jgi:hypothetical protein